MAIIVVQSTGNSTYTSETSAAQAFVSNNTAGNTLIAIGWIGSQSDVPTISDSQSNSGWTLIKSTNFGGATNSLWAFVCFNCKGGANTVTMALNSITAVAMNLFCIAEISGVGVVDQKASNANVTGPTVTTPTINIQQASEIIIAAIGCVVPTPAIGTIGGTSATLLGHSAGVASYGIAEQLVVSTQTGYAGTFSVSSASNGTIIFSLAPAQAAAGGQTGLQLAMDASLRNSGLRH